MIFKKIITCPICGKKKTIDLAESSKNIIKQDKIYYIIILDGMVCEHRFLILCDEDFKIKNYQIIDFEIDKNNHTYDANGLLKLNMDKLFTIKLYFNKNKEILKFIFHSILFKKNILVIYNKDNVLIAENLKLVVDFLFDTYNHFFEIESEKSFEAKKTTQNLIIIYDNLEKVKFSDKKANFRFKTNQYPIERKLLDLFYLKTNLDTMIIIKNEIIKIIKDLNLILKKIDQNEIQKYNNRINYSDLNNHFFKAKAKLSLQSKNLLIEMLKFNENIIVYDDTPESALTLKLY